MKLERVSIWRGLLPVEQMFITVDKNAGIATPKICTVTEQKKQIHHNRGIM